MCWSFLTDRPYQTFLTALLGLAAAAPAGLESRATPASVSYWTGSSCGSGISNAATVQCNSCVAISGNSVLVTNVVSGTVTVYSGSGCSGSSKTAKDLSCLSGFSAKSVKYSC